MNSSDANKLTATALDAQVTIVLEQIRRACLAGKFSVLVVIEEWVADRLSSMGYITDPVAYSEQTVYLITWYN